MKKVFLVVILTIVMKICYANQLTNSIEQGSISQLRLFLESDVNPNLRDENKATALMRATLFNHTEMVKLLLEHNADPNLYDVSRTTPLHLAARQGNIEIVKLLIKYNANPNIKDFSGFTPLLRAITNKNEYIAKVLLNNNAKIFIKNNNNQNSFYLAVENNLPSVMKILIKGLNYSNINYLNILKEQSVQANHQEVANIIQNKITSLENIKNNKDKSITINRFDLNDYYSTKSVKNFPCLNNEISDISIADNICFTFSLAPVAKIMSVAKPIRNLQLSSVTYDYFSNITTTQDKLAKSWVSEPIFPVAKTYSVQLSANISPVAKPIRNLQLSSVTYDYFSNITTTQDKLAKSWVSEPIFPVAKTYSVQLSENIIPIAKTYSVQLSANISPVAKPIRSLQLSSVTYNSFSNITTTQDKLAKSWVSEPIFPIAKTYSVQLSENIIPVAKSTDVGNHMNYNE